MWSKEFEKSVFGSKTIVNNTNNNCYKCYYNGEPFFVKTFILNRNGEKETMDEYRNHIEKTERINEFFIRNGINGAMPVSFDHSYTHLYQGKLYVAYQWIDFLPLRKNNTLHLKVPDFSRIYFK